MKPASPLADRPEPVVSKTPGPARFRKRPVEIEAVQFTGDNGEDIQMWSRGKVMCCVADDWSEMLAIETTEGTMTAQQGDWVIKEIEGEFYPCKDSVFQKTYEAPSSPSQTNARKIVDIEGRYTYWKLTLACGHQVYRSFESPLVAPNVGDWSACPVSPCGGPSESPVSRRICQCYAPTRSVLINNEDTCEACRYPKR